MTEPQIKPTTKTTLTKQQWDEQYGTLHHHTVVRFNEALNELSDLGWSAPRIVERVTDFFDEALDQAFIDMVQAIKQQHADWDAEDEADEEGKPEVRDISAALMKAQAEHAAGTLSPEREAAILSLFGADFFTAVKP